MRQNFRFYNPQYNLNKGDYGKDNENRPNSFGVPFMCMFCMYMLCHYCNISELNQIEEGKYEYPNQIHEMPV